MHIHSRKVSKHKKKKNHSQFLMLVLIYLIYFDTFSFLTYEHIIYMLMFDIIKITPYLVI